ncbi:hypothetical protein QO015_001650 [Kaistia geumhonensis]|uniref:Uncharacterized protein n=1 Tax=Kaistia geumhonensis TaxID=410839 RepID=A0ABU0M4Z5_9HYPH|nr:hypothetical protein [Kaistia geumhonensis]
MLARAMRYLDLPLLRLETPLCSSPQRGGRGLAERVIGVVHSSFTSTLVGEAGRGGAGAARRDRTHANGAAS